MSRTIKDLMPGTIIWIGYNGDLEEWIVTNDSNASRVIVLKKYTLPNKRDMGILPGSQIVNYGDTGMDAWLENDVTGYLSGFDNATLACFSATTIQIYGYGDSTSTSISRRCFLPCQDNMFGNNSIETETSWLPALYLAYDTGDGNTARLARTNNNTLVQYFTRTPFNAKQYNVIKTNGTMASMASYTESWYVRPALSISADTLVSDDGEEIIKLLPDQTRTYREVEFIGYLGSMQQRPAKARVISNAVNLYDVNVQVSNNAKDAEPVWVNATGGGEVTLANTAHTTADFEIGIKCYGKSSYGSSGAVGYFNEPVVLIEEE